VLIYFIVYGNIIEARWECLFRSVCCTMV